MKKYAVLLLSFVALAFRPAEEKQIQVFLVGDSTMANKPDRSKPERGWGMYLDQFFDAQTSVQNHGTNGRSTRNFRHEGRWAKLLAKEYPKWQQKWANPTGAKL
ncbi:hypothetical protein SAMN00120144_3915 [Hymenobacter roseosalivarius DSM 11622]|uniref:Lipolytic protein G-D-S-L family n=1 Tax=Hymenobacter roseosalivarius DSM 11622 TaxID=645990 RepID=A0A1W1VZ45_9BACT|nr:hypothetical protein [Hymenobacter roseosalivarius]SMB98635.1 hypothetical protein SAMN00120144_3915 [Hymenobacter roseosalivarius DSM 11622]